MYYLRYNFQMELARQIDLLSKIKKKNNNCNKSNNNNNNCNSKINKIFFDFSFKKKKK